VETLSVPAKLRRHPSTQVTTLTPGRAESVGAAEVVALA
jgi:hypothetical protein